MHKPISSSDRSIDSSYVDKSVAKEFARLPRTPIADALLRGSRSTHAQFQALPLSGGASIEGSQLQHKYLELYGETYLKAEALFAGKAFDSFFFPEAAIRESEDLAARAFGADEATFVTSGTSVANQISVLALVQPGARVLVDRCSHQSIHFSIHSSQARVDYFGLTYECPVTGRGWFSLSELIDLVAKASREGDPYDLIILNGQSYDGIVYNIPEICRGVLSTNGKVPNFLIDEAWGSANYFSERRNSLTAMRAANDVIKGVVNVVATHSIHKSASALRQGSIILSCGNASLHEGIRHARYKLHTTSPNYPILASIDLARAQLVHEGLDLTRNAERMAADLRSVIASSSELSSFYSVNDTHVPDCVSSYVSVDETKVSINVSKIGSDLTQLKQNLHDHWGIWVRRSTASSTLFNIHIGCNKKSIDRLVSALEEVAKRTASACDQVEAKYATKSECFVIPYPPGIPIVMPGDILTAEIKERISDAQRGGAHIFSIS